jgi:hypothetical protein
VLAYATRQRGVDLEQFVYRFKAAYGREIEPMLGKTQWPQGDLPFLVGASLAKLPVGRRRKLRIKGWMEGGHKKKGSKDSEITKEGHNDIAPANGNGKKKIKGPMTCLKCGQLGHRQASAKCPLNEKKGKT